MGCTDRCPWIIERHADCRRSNDASFDRGLFSALRYLPPRRSLGLPGPGLRLWYEHARRGISMAIQIEAGLRMSSRVAQRVSHFQTPAGEGVLRRKYQGKQSRSRKKKKRKKATCHGPSQASFPWPAVAWRDTRERASRGAHKGPQHVRGRDEAWRDRGSDGRPQVLGDLPFFEHDSRDPSLITLALPFHRSSPPETCSSS